MRVLVMSTEYEIGQIMTNYDKVTRLMQMAFTNEIPSETFKTCFSIIRGYFEPLADSGYYSLSIYARPILIENSNTKIEHIVKLASFATATSGDRPPKLSMTMSAGQAYEAEQPCPQCGGLGSMLPYQPEEMKIPSVILPMHKALVKAFQDERFAAIRENRKKIVVSNLQNRGAGIYQVLFKGVVTGFRADPGSAVALIHYPAIWNFPINATSPDAVAKEMWIFSEAQHDWSNRCENCRGWGCIVSADGATS